MEQQFTEGNWIAQKYSHDWGVYSDKGLGNDIAIVRGDDEKAAAHARLFAQSKKLYELAKHIDAMWDDAYLIGHPEWKEISREATSILSEIEHI